MECWSSGVLEKDKKEERFLVAALTRNDKPGGGAKPRHLSLVTSHCNKKEYPIRLRQSYVATVSIQQEMSNVQVSRNTRKGLG